MTGIRYLDFTRVFRKDFALKSGETHPVIEAFLALKRAVDPENKMWPTVNMKQPMLARFFRERLEKESEVLLLSTGVFSEAVESEAKAANGRSLRIFEVEYGRGSKVNATTRKTRKRSRSRSRTKSDDASPSFASL